MLEGIVRLLSATPDAARVTWRWELDRPSVRVDIDRGQMEQALLNVLKNAVEAIEGEGTITVAGDVRRRSGRRLTVEDTGAGITAEAQSNLFTPFFSTKPQGEGIGLTLVQEILAGHGFHYALERTPWNTTRFTIVLGSPTGVPGTDRERSAGRQILRKIFRRYIQKRINQNTSSIADAAQHRLERRAEHRERRACRSAAPAQPTTKCSIVQLMT